jgi:hypothetical protein
MFLVTTPTIMWAIFAPQPMKRVSPKFFWKDTLQAVMPIAILSGLTVTMSYIFLHVLHPGDQRGIVTTTVLIATFFGIYLVFLVPRMFHIKYTRKTRIAFGLYFLTTILIVLPSFGINFIREFFKFTTPSYVNIWPILVSVVAVAIFQWKIANMAGKVVRDRQN